MSGPQPIEPIIMMDAWLWNGRQRLAGVIQLLPGYIRFQPEDFPDGHLSLQISLSDIEEVDSFLVFNISRLGLLVRTLDGRADRFILEDPEAFRKALNRQLALRR